MRNFLENLFVEITNELDITESQEGAIKRVYNAVSDWLNKNDSSLNKYDILIYPQGSIKLGTIVKPLKGDDYDVDMVCLLRKNYSKVNESELKNLIGNRLKENQTYKNMLQKEGKRCWTLQYSDTLNFHMDILPAKPKYEITNNILYATHKNDNNFYRFIDTNPHDYADWFKSRMESYVKTLYERGSIEKIPEYPKKTTLQQTIQLLKRHRDKMFLEDDTNAPISIIITTLAAKSYNGESSLLDAFESILNNFTSNIKDQNGHTWIENPVLKTENFADKWKTEPIKKSSFYEWIDKLKSDYNELLSIKTSKQLLAKLNDMFGQSIIDSASNNLGGFQNIVPPNLIESTANIPSYLQNALDVPYRQKTPWKTPPWNIVEIEAKIINTDKIFVSTEKIAKELSISFRAVHGIQKPYYLKWQITNTGNEALWNNCPRGDFYSSDENNSNIRTEYTSYSGVHIVQCFIIKNKTCVAKSKEFFVNIM